jgi:hypothetical protein
VFPPTWIDWCLFTLTSKLSSSTAITAKWVARAAWSKSDSHVHSDLWVRVVAFDGEI